MILSFLLVLFIREEQSIYRHNLDRLLYNMTLSSFSQPSHESVSIRGVDLPQFKFKCETKKKKKDREQTK